MKKLKTNVLVIISLVFLSACSYQTRVDKLVSKGTKLGHKVQVVVETDTSITITQNFYD